MSYLTQAVVPTTDEKHLFGIVFNYRDEENYNGVLFDNKKFYYVTKENGAMYTEKKGAVKFGGKRNVPVSVTLVHVGNKLKVSVNNMDIYERQKLSCGTRSVGFILPASRHS